MDLRQLATFLHVAELGSLSKAADRLNIAQPALGRQVRLLEQELGVPLFSRHGRGMTPTPAGRTLVERATAILRLVEDARAEVAAERGAVKGRVSLGVPPTVGEVIAGRLIERFLHEHPAVSIRIVPAFSGYLLDMLQRGEVDLAVMYETATSRHVRAEPLIEERLSLVGPPGTRLPRGRPVAFASLGRRQMILPGVGHGLRTLLEAEAQKAGITLPVAVEADALQTLKDLVARGLGYTVLPPAAVHAEVKAGRLRAAPIVQPSLTRTLVLARSLVLPASNAVRIFTGVLKRETAAMVREGVWQGRLLIRGPSGRS